jgi:hypothetical protein
VSRTLVLLIALTSGIGLGVVTAIPADAGPGNGSLHYYFNVDGNPNWSASQVAGAGTTSSPPAIVRFANSSGLGTELAATAPDGSLHYYFNVDGNPNWSASQVAGAGTTSSAPAIVRFANSSGLGTELAATAPDGSLHYYFNVDGNPNWSASQVAGAGTTSSAPAIVRFANRSGTGTELAATG